MISRGVPLAAVVLALGAVGSACSEDKPVAPVTPPPPVAAAKKAVGRLEAPSGAVTLERESKKRSAAAEDVFAKDAIETGEDGAAVLRFPGDRVVELGPDGRFEIDEGGGGLMLTVAKGLVLTRVPAGARDAGDAIELTISTPFGITRIGAASVQMKVDETTASVDVKVGEIELVSKKGEVTKVGAGKQGTLGAPRELATIALTIVTSAGKAEVKAKDAKGFVPINPKKLPALAAGDTVRVKDGQLALSPDGSNTRVTLARGSEVVILETQKGSGLESTGLDFKKGALQVFAPKQQVTRLGLGGGVTAIAESGAQYSLTKTNAGFDLDATVGDVKLEREGEQAVLVPGGSSATIAGKAVTVKDAAREVVTLPTRNGLKLFHTGLKRVTLTWDGEDEVKDWRVVVSPDPGFERPLLDGVVHERFITVPALAKGPLYWRVYRGDTEHDRGNVAFAPEPSSQDLSRVRNVVPDGPETTTIFFQDKPPVVTFTWAKFDGAAKYKLLVYREGKLQAPVAERVVTEETAVLPENTLGEGKYLWSVTPLDAKGTELKGGRLNKLQMDYDNAVPTLQIRAPRNGDAGGKTVKVAGIAPVGAKLFVNGKPVALDEKARFDTTAAPLPGGRIVFRMVHQGAEIFTLRTVRGR